MILCRELKAEEVYAIADSLEKYHPQKGWSIDVQQFAEELFKVARIQQDIPPVPSR